MNGNEDMRELSVEECWDLLEEHDFGRLAFRIVDELHLTPVNYAVSGRTLLVRTGPGSKLFAAELTGDVVFEIDWYDAREAWSVVVHGTMRRLPEHEARLRDDQAPKPWAVAIFKTDVLEVQPTSVTGRWFRLTGSAGEQALL